MRENTAVGNKIDLRNVLITPVYRVSWDGHGAALVKKRNSRAGSYGHFNDSVVLQLTWVHYSKFFDFTSAGETLSESVAVWRDGPWLSLDGALTGDGTCTFSPLPRPPTGASSLAPLPPGGCNRSRLTAGTAARSMPPASARAKQVKRFRRRTGSAYRDQEIPPVTIGHPVS